MAWSRRDVLRVGAGASLAMALPRFGGAVAGSDLRFVFVFARGGWDTTRVFSPMVGVPGVETEPDAVRVDQGDLAWVDHPDRPAVRNFFNTFGARAAVVDGLLVRSVNHTICERLVQTGSARPDRPDWASILGSVAAADHALPTLVLDGPSNPGVLHRTTSIVGTSGQLQGLLDGGAFGRGDRPVSAPEANLSARIDALVAAGAQRHLDAQTDVGWRRVASAQVDALSRLDRLRVDAQEVVFDANSFDAQTDVAVDLLSANVARVVCIGMGGFDTHADTTTQTPMYNKLFTGLGRLMARLDRTPGRRGATMADETVVVVQSELGRTPYLNSSLGKDHWPYTAAMLLGPGLRGGVRIGGYDETLSGLPVDLASGVVTPSGAVLTSEHLGATLLAMAGLDPAAWVESPVLGALMA